MHKFFNFSLNLVNSFTRVYLLLIIYNRFISDYFQLETTTYWYMFFFSMFIRVIINPEYVYKSLKYIRLEKKTEDLEIKKSALEISKFLISVIFILIIKFLF